MNQQIILFYVCYCLKKPYLLMSNRHCNSCLHTVYVIHIFSTRHISLPALRCTEQHFSTMLRGHFKQWHKQKRHKNAKNVLLNRPWKELWYMVWELKQGGSVTLFNFCWEYAQWFKIFIMLYMSTKWLQKHTTIDFAVTNKFWQVGEFVNTKCVNNKDYNDDQL